jgi:mono/diheme cytochrome c family protein
MTMTRLGLLLLGLAAIMPGPLRADEPAAAAKTPNPVPADHAERMKAGLELFKRDVRPVLVAQCFKCHGGESTKGEFNLSTREHLLNSGHVVPGTDEGDLLCILRHEQEPHMPLKAAKLPDSALMAIVKWIELGAPYDRPLEEDSTDAEGGLVVTDSHRDWWSFRPLSQVPVPKTRSNWVRTPIDQFILDRLRKAGTNPNGPADRRTLIRRASLDLVGLPPDPDEVERFVNDPDPAAYEALIDHLLASPEYGERWARHWMDVSRFAESSGFEHDQDRPNAYHYRDFLIQAFNDDLPFDEMIRWQLAGDEWQPENPLALAATGFLGAGVFPTQLTEAEFESARYDELDDIVTTTGVAFLGLSVGCARCHDHKFDPIPSRDYYRIAAAFTKTIRAEMELDVRGTKTTVLVDTEGLPHLKHHADDRGYPHFYEQTYYLNRGDVHQKQEPVSTGFLQVLMPADDDARWPANLPEAWTRTSFQRARLSQWMTDVEQGAGALAARVIVNRVWQHHFGRGLVATPNDFGTQGVLPSHPELLDWLAGDFVEHGWQLKRLHRLIMTSRTYMQASQFDSMRAAIDPQNELLWRRIPRRLEGEAIRDLLLATAGLLDRTMFGPGTLDEGTTRRSVYFTVKRSQLIPTMLLFDWPEHLVSIGQRAVTTTAPQALFLINNSQDRRYSRAFAERALAETGATSDVRLLVDSCYRIAFGRAPTEQEQASAVAFIEHQRTLHGPAADSSFSSAFTDYCQALMSLSEFIYVD